MIYEPLTIGVSLNASFGVSEADQAVWYPAGAAGAGAAGRRVTFGFVCGERRSAQLAPRGLSFSERKRVSQWVAGPVSKAGQERSTE